MRQFFALALFAITVTAISCSDDSTIDAGEQPHGESGAGGEGGEATKTPNGNAGEQTNAAGTPGTAGTTASGGAGGEPSTPVDPGLAGAAGASGAPSTGPVDCDPHTQAPCAADERCAWVALDNGFTGHTDCLPNGTVAAGGACKRGANGETTGFDNCQRGFACEADVCQDICNAKNNTGCAAGATCVPYYASPFNPDGQGDVGFCALTCNPLTQKRSDGAEACGSPTPATPSKGCYGTPGHDFTCETAGAADKVSDVTPFGSSPSDPYINGCAPGFMPLLVATTGSADAICVAVCDPAPTSTATPGNAGGKVGGTTCASKGAAGTHECRYWWRIEDPTAASYPSPFANTLGYCFDYTKYKWDSNGRGSVDAADGADPSCKTLSNTAHTYSQTQTDDVYWGCAPLP